MEKMKRIKQKIDEIIEKISIDELVDRIQKVEIEDYDIIFSEELFLEEPSIYIIEDEIFIEEEYTEFSVHKSKTNLIFNIFSRNKKENLDMEAAA